jgi:hypothetical protein
MQDKFFNQSNYISKIKSVTNLRIFSFQIWKFIIGMISFYFFTKITQNYYVSEYLLSRIKFHFNIIDYLKLFILFAIIDYYKFVIFENYEDNTNNTQLAMRIILEPRHQTIFIMINTILVSMLLKILEKNSNSLITDIKRKRLKFPDYEVHMIIFG